LTTNGTGACGTYGSYSLLDTGQPSPATDTVPSDHTCYRYELIVDDSLGVDGVYTSPDIKVDTTAPAAPTLSFSAFSNSFWNGSVVYYKNGAAITFTVTASSTDIYAGIASYGFPTSAPWTSTAGSLGVNTYGGTAPTATTTRSVTATNNAGTSSANASFTLQPDATAPAGVGISISHPANAGPVTVTLNPTDGESGVRLSTGQLGRRSATTCGTLSGAYVTIATAPASPYTDASLPTGNCYQYQYIVSDNVGNQTTYVSATAQIN
jgi:hypothetical protein